MGVTPPGAAARMHLRGELQPAFADDWLLTDGDRDARRTSSPADPVADVEHARSGKGEIGGHARTSSSIVGKKRCAHLRSTVNRATSLATSYGVAV